jgi:hypothetical protein
MKSFSISKGAATWFGALGAAFCLMLTIGAAARADDNPITVQTLIDRAEIQDLITHYYYNFGRENPENFADFYTEDAELILGERHYKGPEGIASAYGRGGGNEDRPAAPRRYTFNVEISNPLITVHGDTATSQVMFTEYVIEKQGDPLQVTTTGREYATFVRTAAGWRYKTRQIMGGNEPPAGWME